MPKFNLGKSLHGALSRSTHGGSGAETYAQRHLMEEVTTLRRRVKEMEEKEETLSSGNGSNKTVDTDLDEKELQEVMNLRKELNRVENEKAAMELDFMNQLSHMARDSAEKLEAQQKKVEQKENVNESNKIDEVGGGDSAKDAEMQQLKEDLSSADKELEVNRRDVDSLQNKLNKLEAQKSALIEENTAIRLEVDNESKVISSLNDIMAENEKHFQSRIQKLEVEGLQKDGVILKKQEETKALNDTIVKQQGQKAMLLEEITDLRLQLDRNDDDKKDMQRKLDELAQEQSGEATESVRVGSLKQAASDASEKADEMKEEVQTLQNELRSLQKSYKGDVSRLEEAVATKNLEVEQATSTLEERETELKKLVTEHEQLQRDAKELKDKFDETKTKSSELEQEVATLESQRVFYEKRTSHCIMEQMTEADDARAKLVKLEKELQEMEKTLATQKETNEQLNTQMTELKTKRPVAKKTFPPTFPPVPLTTQSSFNRSVPSSPSGNRRIAPSSPSHQRATSSCPPSPSSKGNSVRALAACFEGKNTKDENTKDAEVKDADVKDTNSAGETTDVTTISSLQLEFSHDAAELQNRVMDLEGQLEDAQGKNEMLQQRLKKQSEQVGELHAEVAALSASRAAIESLTRKGFDNESEDFKNRIENLESELADARERLEAESKQVESLKSEIREMTSERFAYEECTMEAYEKRAATTQKTYQGDLNNLKVQLTSAQMKIAKLEKDHASEVKELEDAIEELNAECDKELEVKQGELDMIKYKVDEQVDIVSKLQREREQLCVQMNGASTKRRDELEEVQSELMERTAENQSLQRALQSLQMQVEHHTDSSRELEQLRVRVRELESQRGPTGTAKHKQEFELERLEEANRKLKDQVRNVTFERRALQEKLNTIVTSQSEERTTNVLRERNEKLRREVERLNRKLQRKEGSINRIAI